MKKNRGFVLQKLKIKKLPRQHFIVFNKSYFLNFQFIVNRLQNERKHSEEYLPIVYGLETKK